MFSLINNQEFVVPISKFKNITMLQQIQTKWTVKQPTACHFSLIVTPVGHVHRPRFVCKCYQGSLEHPSEKYINGANIWLDCCHACVTYTCLFLTWDEQLDLVCQRALGWSTNACRPPDAMPHWLASLRKEYIKRKENSCYALGFAAAFRELTMCSWRPHKRDSKLSNSTSQQWRWFVPTCH